MKAWIFRKYMISDKTGEIHGMFFHGKGHRSKSMSLIDSSLSKKFQIPLSITLNYFNLPKICCPASITNLIVMEKVKLALSNFSNIDFDRVIIEKLIFFPFYIGLFDYSEYKYRMPPDFITAKDIFDSLPPISDNQNIPGYFELIPAVHFEIVEEYKEAKNVLVPGMEPQLSKENIKLSIEMLTKYPIIFTHRGYILRDDFYEAINQFVDFNYFHAVPFEI